MSRNSTSTKSKKAVSRPAKLHAKHVPSSQNINSKKKVSPNATQQPIEIQSKGRSSKQKLLIDILGRPEGATLDQMISLTGWQAHSVRGVISGTLKKKLGLAIVSSKNDAGLRHYHLAVTSAHE